MTTHKAETMVITKGTANRIKNFCHAIETGFTYPMIPTSAYTYSELAGTNPMEKAQSFLEAGLASGSTNPSRANIRKYNKVAHTFGTTHDERMSTILELKLEIFHREISEAYNG